MGVIVVCTTASWPDLAVATTFFIADLLVVIIFLSIRIARDPRRVRVPLVFEEPEPRDPTTGRLD
jgi:hypothetical protein